MGNPFSLRFIDKTILNFIISTYFGIKNPLPTLVCLPGLIAGNPKVYLQLVATYGSVLGAITSLVALGYTIRYATRIVKKIIQKIKHRPLKPVENKFIGRVAKDAKHTKKVTKKNLRKFLPKLTPKQNKAITNKIKKFKKFKFGETHQNLSLDENNINKLKKLSFVDLKSTINSFIDSFKKRVESLQTKNSFGSVADLLFNTAIASGKISEHNEAENCRKTIRNFKKETSEQFVKLDKILSKVESKEQRISGKHSIYKIKYKRNLVMTGLDVVFHTTNSFDFKCSNISKVVKNEAIDMLKNFDNRITELENLKNKFGRIHY